MENQRKKSDGGSENVFNTPYDDVFRTLLEKCSQLIIPVINEVFHTDYSMNDPVKLLSNEHYFKDENGKPTKKVTDSCVLIGENMYHIECQSTKDSNMEIRMVEYDFHIALANAERKEGIQTLQFPESAVLYLRSKGKMPGKLQVRLILPDKSEALYAVPAIKVQDYDRKVIFDRKLLFFIPYYILRFEKEMAKIDSTPDRLEELKQEYAGIHGQLLRLNEQKIINGQYLRDLVELTDDLIKVTAGRAENVRRELTKMGGKVLELGSEKILQEGMQKGIEKGREEGMEIGREEGWFKADVNNILRSMNKLNMSFEKACEHQDIPAGEYGKYREAVEAKQREVAAQRNVRRGR